MRDKVKEILEELAREAPHKIIEGEELLEVYTKINEKAEKIRLDYNMREALSEIAASKSYITD